MIVKSLYHDCNFFFFNANILFLELKDSALSDPSGPTFSLKPAYLQPMMIFPL